jgi:hypothetical protein
MTILFHITPSDNLPSILKHGLIPKRGKGLTTGPKKYIESKVWLTDNPEYILRTQAGETWIKSRNPIILRVNCRGLDIKQRTCCPNGIPIIMPHEFYFEGIIKSVTWRVNNES